VIVLGVDPGLRRTGYGAIRVDRGGAALIEGGVLEPNPKAPLERRLHELHVAMCDVIRSLQPDCMIVEELWSAYEHPQTAVLMGHARGVLCLAAGAHGVRVEPLAHALVKRALTGAGAARKAQVGAMVARMLGLREIPQPNDVTDALALALAFAMRDGSKPRSREPEIAVPPANAVR